MSSNGTSALRCLLLSATVLAAPGMALAGGAPGTLVPSGQLITIPNSTYGASYQTLNPGLADHPTYQAGQALNTVLSPDGSTLLVLTSGYNLLNYSSGPNAGQGEPSASNEYVFVYNVIGTFQQNPHLVQVIQVPNSFIGLTWAPASNQFYVSGGANDDVLSFTRQGAFFAQTGSVALGHPFRGECGVRGPCADAGRRHAGGDQYL